MFARRFFPDRYYAPRYFPKVGADPIVVEVFPGYAAVFDTRGRLLDVIETRPYVVALADETLSVVETEP